MKSIINWKVFLSLFTAGIISVVAIFPFILTVQGDILADVPFPLPVVLLLSLVQSSVILALVIFFGLFLGKKIGLGAPVIESWLATSIGYNKIKSIAKHSVLVGLLAGGLILAFDYVLAFFMAPFPYTPPAIWKGFFASFYGGIFEEILLRLFFVTVIAWILHKLTRSKKKKASNVVMIVSIVIAAIVFGIAHLPATAALVDLTPIIIFRAILLNGIGGLLFGWLYWKKGLLSAMIAHFTADIVLHVIFASFIL